MRLLYVSADPGVPVLGHKGASVHVRELVEALAAAGTSVTIASPRIRYEGERIAADVELVAINPVLPKDYATPTALRRAVREQAVQVVELARARGIQAIYERFSLFSNAGARAAAELGIPHALEVNAPLCDEARRFRTLPHPEEAAAIESVVLASTDHVFAVSEELRGVLVDDGVEPEKVEVLPNAVHRGLLWKSQALARNRPLAQGGPPRARRRTGASARDRRRRPRRRIARQQ
jgi:hypothetical protein